MESAPSSVPPAPEAVSTSAATPLPGNPPLAIVGGAVAAAVGAAIWAAVTVATKYQIGYMAIGVGFLVGLAVRAMGKGSTPFYGVIGAVFSLVGCAAGNLLSVIGFFSQQAGLPFFDVLGQLNMDAVTSIMKETFDAMDLLFYAIAVYFGFKFSIINRG